MYHNDCLDQGVDNNVDVGLHLWLWVLTSAHFIVTIIVSVIFVSEVLLSSCSVVSVLFGDVETETIRCCRTGKEWTTYCKVSWWVYLKGFVNKQNPPYRAVVVANTAIMTTISYTPEGVTSRSTRSQRCLRSKWRTRKKNNDVVHIQNNLVQSATSQDDPVTKSDFFSQFVSEHNTIFHLR